MMPTAQFQLTAARRRLPDIARYRLHDDQFQLTAARRRLPVMARLTDAQWEFQLTAARRRLLFNKGRQAFFVKVSTHGRPKAAAPFSGAVSASSRVSTHGRPKAAASQVQGALRTGLVSTHGRPKAAADHRAWRVQNHRVFQLTAARRRLRICCKA